MRVKTASTLIAYPIDSQFAVFNYLTKSSVKCDAQDLRWLSVATDWTEIEQITQTCGFAAPVAVRTVIGNLIELGLLVEEGSPAAEEDTSYSSSWKLGRAAGFLHFLATDNPYVDNHTSIQGQIEKAKNEPPPPAFWSNSGEKIKLPLPDFSTNAQVYDVMRKRRTNRFGQAKPITLQQLSDCLKSGLGITAFVQTKASVLPLKMTPSGGARNPFEAFVLAKNVTGLAPGSYHYAAIDHTLAAVQRAPDYPFSELLAGQDWADSMPALIVLVASFERTGWKYQNPNSYRVVLIEAGHIAQNIMLAGTCHGLTVCPTAALADTKLKMQLALMEPVHAPIYALAIAHPGVDPDEVIPVEAFLADSVQPNSYSKQVKSSGGICASPVVAAEHSSA